MNESAKEGRKEDLDALTLTAISHFGKEKNHRKGERIIKGQKGQKLLNKKL
jgi:hypothetical protein